MTFARNGAKASSQILSLVNETKLGNKADHCRHRHTWGCVVWWIHTYKHVRNWELRSLFHFLFMWQLLPIRECGAITLLATSPGSTLPIKLGNSVSLEMVSWPTFGLTNFCKIPVRQRVSHYCVWKPYQGQCFILQEPTDMQLHWNLPGSHFGLGTSLYCV